MKIKHKEIWMIRSKEGNGILEMPDGTTEFDTEYKAKNVLQSYTHRDKYYVLHGSSRVEEKSGEKIDKFMND